MKKEGTYGRFPSEEKLTTTLMNEMTLYETFLYLQEKERSVSELSELLGLSEDQVTSCIETLRKKKIWQG
jgi:chromosome segregation and condensation protein ScpB